MGQAIKENSGYEGKICLFKIKLLISTYLE